MSSLGINQTFFFNKTLLGLFFFFANLGREFLNLIRILETTRDCLSDPQTATAIFITQRFCVKI